MSERLTIPARELAWSFARASGPGGQHVNKVETAVELRWTPETSAVLAEDDRAQLLDRLSSRLSARGELIVLARRHRSQARNRDEALDKLASIVAEALVRSRARKPTRPSRAAQGRRVEAKRRRGHKKRERSPPD